MDFMNRHRRNGFALLAALVGAPAVAAPPEAGSGSADEAVVVTGTPLGRGERERLAEEFVRRAGIARGMRPAARWTDPVCPRAAGLDPAHAAIVEADLRAAAKAIGVRLAGRKCSANVTVTFVADGAAFMRTVAARAPGSLREVRPEDRESLMSGAAPVRWFYTSEVRGSDGDAPMNLPQPGVGVDTSGGVGQLSSPGRDGSLAQRSSSHVSTRSARALTSATVVIDVERATGLPLSALTAYAAMVAFAEMRPGDPPPAGSILGLFGSDPEARGLTGWDLALLRRLYRMPLDREARRHRGELVRALVTGDSTPGSGKAAGEKRP